MAGTARIAQFAFQPGQPLLQQGHRHRAPFRIAGTATGRIMQKLNQGGADLLCSAATLQMLEGMPLPITQLQAVVQGHGEVKGLRRPGGAAASGLWR